LRARVNLPAEKSAGHDFLFFLRLDAKALLTSPDFQV
jgi:hypothetical protein